MRAPFVLSLSLLLLVAAPVVGVQESTGSGRIVVRGDGEATAAPDRAAVTVSLVSRAVRAAVAADDNASRQAAVMEALRAPTLEVEELTTGAYVVQPRWRRDDNGNRTVVGYEARISISAETGVLAGVGAIIDAALAAGADQVDRVSFRVADAVGLRRLALANAVAAAVANAEAMAQAAGGRLGQLLELTTEQLSSAPVPVAELRMAAEPAPRRAVPDLAPADATARASVIGRWQFVRQR